MLECKIEKLHCGSICFAVYGIDDNINFFVDYLKISVNTAFDVRVIAGRDHSGKIKIAITGDIVEQLSLETFRHQVIDDFNSR